MTRVRRGFTLVELLVVMGIITVLLTILIPVVSSVRKSAQTATTNQRLVMISTAIHAYYMDNGAYPGLLPNNTWRASPPATYKIISGTTVVGNTTAVTSSEDMAVALMGGLEADAAGNPTFDMEQTKQLLGNGPLTFNKLNPSKKNAYLAFRPEELTPIGTNDAGNKPAWRKTADLPNKGVPDYGHLTYVADSEIPEFIDTVPGTPRPILYLRANPAAVQGDYGKMVSQNYDSTVGYSLSSVAGYFKTTNPGADKLVANPTSDQTTKDYFTNFLVDPSVDGSARSSPTPAGKVTAKYGGSYVLIAAGPDRIFGTNDDVIVSGGGGGGQ